MDVILLITIVICVLILAGHVIEFFFPYDEPPMIRCTCLRWRAPAEPLGYRVVRDHNCPVHTEG